MDKGSEPGSWRTFSVFLTGKTIGAHQPLVEKLIKDGHKEVGSSDSYDYLLVFCPAVSRVQSDILNGLSRIPADKPIILVVMHHTFDPDHIVAESRRHVMNQNVCLTVDYLFHQHELLNCDLNNNSWTVIKEFLQLPIKKGSLYQNMMDRLPKFWEKFSSSSTDENTSQNNGPVGVKSCRKFSVFLTGKTNGAHKPLVEKLRHDGHKEVGSHHDYDYLLVFCPTVSRVQSDILNGLSRIPADKPIILVVMHHTFDPNHIVAESWRQVMNQNVRLTVDYLFYQHELLNCDLNNNSWTAIKEFVQLPVKKGSSWKNMADRFPRPWGKSSSSSTDENTSQNNGPAETEPKQKNVGNMLQDVPQSRDSVNPEADGGNSNKMETQQDDQSDENMDKGSVAGAPYGGSQIDSVTPGTNGGNSPDTLQDHQSTKKTEQEHGAGEEDAEQQNVGNVLQET